VEISGLDDRSSSNINISHSPPQTFPAKIQQSFDVGTVTYSRRVSARGIGLASVLQKEKKILAAKSQTALKQLDTSVLPISALSHYSSQT